MSEYDLHVLYIPDEWSDSVDETYSQVLSQMEQLNIKKVDIVIMHGQFKYQLVNAPDSIPKHDEMSYLDITKYFIHIGHVHKHSIFERILAQGSFDRLTHGEEEDKGFMLVHIDGHKSTFYFVVNTQAKIYKTINIDKIDSLDVLDNRVSKYPIDSHIRFLTSRNHEFITTLFDQIRLRYFNYNIKKKKIDGKNHVGQTNNQLIDVSIQTDTNSYTISEDNIRDMLTKAISDKINEGVYNFTVKHWEVYNTL
jgi:hypothetical protein